MGIASRARPSRRDRVRAGVAAIGRAHRLVATLGGRFSTELGIELDRGPDEIERWALASTLFGNRISTSVALRTYRVLERAGVRTIADAGDRRWSELVALLDDGGYVRYDQRTATRLLALAEAVGERYAGRLATLGERVSEPVELERELAALPGWGQVTIRAFLRELRGIWPGADTRFDERTLAAVRHLHLPDDDLDSIAVSAHLDLRDLEAGLVRLGLSHDLTRCPGGEECPFVSSERDEHFRG